MKRFEGFPPPARYLNRAKRRFSRQSVRQRAIISADLIEIPLVTHKEVGLLWQNAFVVSASALCVRRGERKKDKNSIEQDVSPICSHRDDFEYNVRE